ncbi:hypothetical protein [Anaeromicropila herbilytica]|uniref:Abortive infection protein n=1 Tax=Anaeromicropila herbilytica TaxID=2785025 RepID=A0A7R7EQG8_9FIRM|nr:hypothetical protein [Anaeromicropila herbilytica]BCN32657.1 hypothetical protein bsdtb5_39520 [Anaeromicropila herbilytica]
MIIVWYFVASFLAFIIFGAQIIVSNTFEKIKVQSKLTQYISQILSLVAFLVMYKVSSVKIPVLNLTGVISIKSVTLLIITVIVTAFIVSSCKKERHNLFEWFIGGVLMEIPQRLFMQTFFMIVLSGVENGYYIAILLNAILWVQFIILQEIISGSKINRVVIMDSISSAFFSIGVGLLYVQTGCILMTMLAHGLERIVSVKMGEYRGNI